MQNRSVLGLASLLGPLVACTAHAEIYMNDAQAQKSIFPGELFSRGEVALTDEEAEKIEEESGQRVRDKKFVLWKNGKGDFVFIDQALGKHEFITYAVGIDKQGQVKGIEILEYRESYGQQVKNEKWRAQFIGKTKSAPLKLTKDIQNISGATLSSAHITAGVKKIIFTYETIRKRI